MKWKRKKITTTLPTSLQNNDEKSRPTILLKLCDHKNKQTNDSIDTVFDRATLTWAALIRDEIEVQMVSWVDLSSRWKIPMQLHPFYRSVSTSAFSQRLPFQCCSKQNARYPPCPPTPKNSPPRKKWWKTSKKSATFYFGTLWVPAAAAATSIKPQGWCVKRLAALALQSSLPSAFTAECLNARVNAQQQLSRFLLFVFVPHQRTKLHTHTHTNTLLLLLIQL